MSASTKGAPEFFKAFEPAAPAPKNKIKSANDANINIEPVKPRGNERTGSFASSAASGTPSTARKNQMA
ncbi:hypothetical protein D9M71_746230 [compost metagenome]